MKLLISTALGLAASVFLASPSTANEIKAPKQTCTTTNCSSMSIVGQVGKTERCCGFLNFALPWIVQVYADANECLRLDVTSQTTNTEMVVLDSIGEKSWRNDNSNATCKTCPQLRIVTGDKPGYYTVRVATPTGNGVDGTFTLRYGRYASTNPNCKSPSRPLG